MKLNPVLLIIALSTPVLAQDQTDPAPVDTAAVVIEASEASLAWLALVDAGDYEESWEAAAASFRAAVTSEQLADALAQARLPFEPFGDRTVSSTYYSTEFPDLPGEWVVIQYATETAGGDVVERMSMIREEDGAFRCGGYYVLPPNQP